MVGGVVITLEGNGLTAKLTSAHLQLILLGATSDLANIDLTHVAHAHVYLKALGRNVADRYIRSVYGYETPGDTSREVTSFQTDMMVGSSSKLSKGTTKALNVRQLIPVAGSTPAAAAFNLTLVYDDSTMVFVGLDGACLAVKSVDVLNSLTLPNIHELRTGVDKFQFTDPAAHIV